MTEASLHARAAVLKWTALTKALAFLRKLLARFISNQIVYRITGSWVWVVVFIVVVLAVGFYIQSGQPAV